MDLVVELTGLVGAWVGCDCKRTKRMSQIQKEECGDMLSLVSVYTALRRSENEMMI